MNKPTFEIQEVQFESDKWKEEFEKYYAWTAGVGGSLRLKAIEDFISNLLAEQKKYLSQSEKSISSHTNQLIEEFRRRTDKHEKDSFVIYAGGDEGCYAEIDWDSIENLLSQTEQECDKKWRLKIEGMKRGVNDEEPFVPFYKPYGMGEEEYASEIHRHEQERAEWQSNCEYNQALDDLLNNK